MKKLMMIMVIGCVMATFCGCQKDSPAQQEQPTTESVEATVVEEVPEGTTTEEVATEGAAEDLVAPTSAEEGDVSGIVVDASMNYFMVQAEDGSYYSFSKDDNTKVNCADGILLGAVVDVHYTGSSDAGDAVAMTIGDSSLKTNVDPEVLQYATLVIQTVKFMDQETLAGMMTYPTYVGVGDIDETVKDEAAFMALDRDTLFPEDLVGAVADYNLFHLESTEAGYVLGEGKPNIIFKEDANNADGFGIVGINGK